jgi:Mrp family chromosome partitioning ATPase
MAGAGPFAAAAASLARGTDPGRRRTVALTAATSGEGVTMATAGIARDLAEGFGLDVLAVALAPGLAARLPAGVARVEEDAVAAAPAGLALLELGGAGLPPAVLRARVAAAVAAARGFVLLDAPPLDAGVKGLVAAEACGEAVLVIRAGRLPRDAAIGARDMLGAAGVALAGTVLTGHRDPVPRWLRGWVR